MDKILQGILISNHPEPLKDRLIQRIMNQAEQEEDLHNVQSILELSVQWSLHGSTKFQIHSGIHLYSTWAKYHVPVVKEFFTVDFLIDLMTEKYENPNVALILIDKTLTVLEKTPCYSILSERFSKLCINFLEGNLNLECLFILVQILNKFKECIPQERITDFSKITIDILSKTEIPENYSDRIYLLQKISLIADLLKHTWHEGDASTVEESLLKLFTVISSPHIEPSQCLGSVISCLPLKMVGETFNLTQMSNIGNLHISHALIRMMSWLQWPTSKHVDIWVIAIFEELEFMKKYDILIELTEKNIEFLFNCLKIVLSRDEALKIFSHMLLRCHHNPAPFHKIIKLFPEVFTELKAENSISSTRCLRDLVELCHIQMYIHSGFPDLYEPVLKLTMETPTPALTFIKAVIEKYSSKCWGSSTPVVLSWSTREFLSMSPTKRLGLYNLSNTCYMNCTVQVLFLLDDFRRHLLKLSPSSKKILLYEMQRLFSFLLSSQRPAISPKSFYQASKPTWFNAFEQQDCVEFFSFLIQKLDEEQNGMKPANPTNKTLAHYFTGKIRNLFHCNKCCETFLQNEDSFTTINLAIPANNEHEYNLTSLLEHYFQPEEMSNTDQIYCAYCESLQNGKRWVEILEPPQYLTLILMRFSYDNILGKKVKIMDKVKYPIEISIPVVDRLNHGSMFVVYVLCSVIIHSGSSSDSGHYYCFGRQSSVVNLNPFKLGDILKDEWYLFNDERVTYTEFMSSEKLGNYPQDTPYLLIYRMIDNKLISNAVGPQITLEQDQNFIPGRFKMEIRKDNAAFHKEEDSIITLSTGNKRKRDFDPNERGPPGSCGGGGNSSFSQIDTAGAKFIF